MSSLTFVGTATTVLRLGAFTVLTDPNFLHRGQRAYLGKGLWSRRLTEPALQSEQLPALDAVVLSHLHGDHFDRVARRGLSREPPVLTTPAAARRLRGWGFAARGLRTWERHELVRGQETLSVESLPAVHARGLMGLLLPARGWSGARGWSRAGWSGAGVGRARGLVGRGAGRARGRRGHGPRYQGVVAARARISCACQGLQPLTSA